MFHDDDTFGEIQVLNKDMLRRMPNAELKRQMVEIKEGRVLFIGTLYLGKPYEDNQRKVINVIKRIIRKRNQNKV